MGPLIIPLAERALRKGGEVWEFVSPPLPELVSDDPRPLSFPVIGPDGWHSPEKNPGPRGRRVGVYVNLSDDDLTNPAYSLTIEAHISFDKGATWQPLGPSAFRQHGPPIPVFRGHERRLIAVGGDVRGPAGAVVRGRVVPSHDMAMGADVRIDETRPV